MSHSSGTASIEQLGSDGDSADWLRTVARQCELAGHDHLPAHLGNDLILAWEVVCRHLGIDSTELLECVARVHGVPAWDGAMPDMRIAQRLPELAAQRFGALAVGMDGATLQVAVGAPGQSGLHDALAFATNMPVQVFAGTPAQIAMHGMSLYSGDGGRGEGMGRFDLDTPLPPRASAVVRLVNLALRQAVVRGATDLHLQPLPGGAEIRFRVDGVLKRAALLQRVTLRRCIGRIKAVAGMNSTDRLRPHDGSVRVRCDGADYDLRLSSVPVDGDEKLVARFLARQTVRAVADLGFEQPELSQLATLLKHGMGMLLVTGPTGSGKTTALYAALAEKNRTEVNIVTVEDPVEYRIARLTQIQINPKAGLTFATALRSIRRQDPDIILIGEIRDAETAELAVQAAMTGHLVLATLHTNDAIGAVARLLDLGVTAPLLAETLIGASAQRLVRRLCAGCATDADESDELAAWIRLDDAEARPRKAVGCEACGWTGYRGRFPVAQVFVADEAIKEAIVRSTPRQGLERMARDTGMRTLAEAAYSRVRNGDTSADEAERVLGAQIWSEIGRRRRLRPPRLAEHPVRETAEDSGRILFVSRDPERRAQIVAELVAGGHPAIGVHGSDAALEWLSRHADVSLMVMDCATLKPERAKILLGVRNVLAGVQLPVLAVVADTDSALAHDVTREEGVTVIGTPRAGEWNARVEDVLAATAEPAEKT